MPKPTRITDIRAREILDSRGYPSLQVEVRTQGGQCATACAPSGASTGVAEALELRDGEPKRYMGKGVLRAVENVNTEIKQRLVGMDAVAQAEIDDALIKLDGRENKSRLGANATIAVSLAAAKAGAAACGVPLYAHLGMLCDNQKFALPVPQMNIINGGAHADNAIDFQEFMILPARFSRFADTLRCGVEIFHALRQVLQDRGYNTAVGDEGGFAPQCQSNEEAVELIIRAIDRSGYRAGEQVWLGLDVAASELYRDGKYHLAAENLALEADELVDYLAEWTRKYPILSIEDGMAEDDWRGWKLLTEKLGAHVQLTGDDLFVTNTKLLRRGVDEKIANAILIKLNQIGTLSETVAAIKMAQAADFGATISHRSGETEDTTIADLAVGSAAGQIKTGSLCRGERVAKYNRLLKIEEELGDAAHYSGAAAFAKFQ